ncbi:MAG: hypothetical protein AAFR12_09855 [Cyanobacteria bacterium J06626_6]
MIYYLARSAHSYTIDRYLESWGYPATATFIRPLHYEQLWKLKKLPRGTYIFADIERLTPNEAETTARIWQQLSSNQAVCLLNHPTRSKRRYGLLRSLYNKGVNQFNVYRLTESHQPQKYPVFIRSENDHTGNLTWLLNTSEELENAIHRLVKEGKSLEDKIITEFCSTADEGGVFRKYSAFIVGERIIPRHLFFNRNWMIKCPGLVTERQALEEEYEYVKTNPHESALREIFQLADIKYGRIDYSLLNGLPQIWEINTNPASLSLKDMFSESQKSRALTHQHFARDFASALKDIDVKAGSSICLDSRHDSKSGQEKGYQVSKDVFRSLLQLLPYAYALRLRRQLKVARATFIRKGQY